MIILRNSSILLIYISLTITTLVEADKKVKKAHDTEAELLDKEYGVKYATDCEVCKYLAIELEGRFNELGQTSQVLETGYQIDQPKKEVKYTRSELYFIEALEKACERILEYNIHKERGDSTRFSRGMSSTFKTLHELVDKGVKVDLGIPMELWDSPSAEITALKQQCENNLEKYDNIIEQWYWGDRSQKLQDYLCRQRVLKKEQQNCLDDPEAPAPIEYTPKSKLGIEIEPREKESNESESNDRQEL